MNKSLHTFSIGLLVALFASPFLATVALMLTDGSLFDSAKNQYALLQVIVMAVYCLPVVIVSATTLYIGSSMTNKNRHKISKTLYIASIVSSLIGIGIMTTWVFQSKNDIDNPPVQSNRQLQSDSQYSYITRNEAVDLLNNCGVKLFLYGNMKDETVKSILPTSVEGVVLEKFQGKPLAISVTNDAKDVLLPVATESDKKCQYLDINEVK